MKKTLLAVLFCLCLMILLPMAFAEAETYDLYVGGVQVTSANMGSITGKGIALAEGGYVRYDPTTSTLSLKDVTVTGGVNTVKEGYAYAVYAGSALNIEASGTVTLKGNDVSTGAYGIYAASSLHITNNGDFTAQGFISADREVNSYGIRCISTLSIVNNGTFRADGLKGPRTSLGIRANGDITFDGKGTAYVLGRNALRIIDFDRNITINSGTVIATVTYPKNTSINQYTEYGIECDVLTVAKDAYLKVDYSGDDVYYSISSESYKIDNSKSYAINCNTMIVEGKVEADNPKLAISGDLVHTPGIAYQIWRSLGAVNAKYDTSYGTAYYVLIAAETGNGVRGSCAVSTADPERFVYTIQPVAGAKYSMDGGAWQESNVFDLIEPQSKHSFLVAAIDDSIFESSGNITFHKLPNDNVPSLRYAVSGSSGDRTLTITPVEGAEYSFDGGATWGADNTQANISVETLTIAIHYKETAVQYASVSVSAEVDLTGTAPSISFDEGEVDKVYGDGDFVVAATVANIDGALTYTTSDVNIAQADNTGRVHISKAGTVTVTAAFLDAEGGEASAQYTLNIAPAALTVKADDKAMFAGAEKPVYTATATGLVNGDTITGITYMDNADTTRNGSYSIMPHGGSISSGNDNYAISYATGTLTVTVDGSGIETAVEAANAAMEGVAVDDGLPEDVLSGTRFVSTANMTALTDSITDAEKVKDTVSAVDELQAAINTLNQAITDFTASIQTGTMIVYTVDAAASPASGGTVSGGGSYRAGENVTVEAVANSGYRFVKWTENGAIISTSPSYTIPSISTSRALVAEFEVDTSVSLGYIAFESAKSFTLSVNTKLWNGRLMVSTDGASWSEWDGSKITAGTIGTDYAIYLRGYGNRNISGLSDIGRFVLTGSGIACRGNIENLLDCEVVAEGNHPMMDSNCFAHLFSGCTALTSAPALPATTLAGSCYNYMFDGCTALTAAPALPATTLAGSCYAYMFRNCSSLTAAPALPATTLADSCYRDMFIGCTALTTAPVLPATTLTGYCYDSMFKGCTALTTAPALPATTLATACYRGMFEGCTALTAAPALPATALANYCYRAMFNGCTGIAISETQTAEYSTPWRIPTEGTAASATDWSRSMLSSTGGTFKSNPTLGTTYYQKGKAPKTAAPVFAPDGGAFTGSVNVTITCATDGADIYYTTDDTEPTASSSKYENAITLTESATIKAIAVKNGMTGSDIASATFTKSEPVLGGTAAIKGAVKYGETLSMDISGITGSTGTLHYQWMSGGIAVGENQATYTLSASDIGNVISCVVTDSAVTGSVTATLDVAVAKADGPAAPTGLKGIAPTAYGRNGMLAGTTPTMEYSADAVFTAAASCTDDETVVPAGTYYVRYKERATQKASASTQVVVPSYIPPTVTGVAVNSTAHKTEYFVGDALDVTELTLLATKSDDTKETVAVTEGMVSGFDSSAAVENQELTITYEGQTTTYTITIKVPAPTIIGVTVSPANANVELGRTQQFTAEVSGTGDYDSTVTWSVTGAFSSGTDIDENGLLTVAEDETPGMLTVTATAKGDSTKSGTAEVRVLSVFTVTFKVANGTWSDGTSGDKTLQVADDATLTAADVPSPGTPNEGYQPASAGAWDTVPNTTTPIGSDMTYTFTFVEKETPNIGTVLADKTTVYQGTALSDIGLSRSNETIPGTLAWQPGQTLVAGENACDWTFTPIDTDQYKVLTGSITITVLADTPDTLTVKTLPAKAVYAYGEAFDKTGLVLTLIYQSGKTEDIAADAVTVADTTLAVGQAAVNVSYGGLTCDVPVTVNKAEQTIMGDGFSLTTDTTVELADKFTAEGALSYGIAAGDPTGSSVSGSSLTAGSTAGTFTLNILAAETDNYNASQKQVTVTVTPAPVTLYTLTVVNGTGSSEYASGTAVNIAADAPAEGKRFKSWTTTDGGSFGDASSASTTYTMPAGSATITASYEDIPLVTYTVTVTADPTEGGTVTGGGSYSAGTNATVTATANDGYQFINWTRDGNVVGTEASFTFTVSGNISLTAHFDRAPVPPVIIEGENRVVIQGNEALFVSDADFSLFQRVLVDGSELTLNADYAAVSGSTRVTLLGSFTRTLSLSKHSLDIVSSTGTATTEFTIVKATENSLDITRHPEDQFVVEGQKATFSVSVSGGTLPYAYQWYINRGDGASWKKLGGATDASYTTSVTKLANNSYKYYCTVSDAEGQAEDSNKATLFVSQYVPLPQTGDDSQPLLWLGLMLAGSVGIVTLALRGKKKQFDTEG